MTHDHEMRRIDEYYIRDGDRHYLSSGLRECRNCGKVGPVADDETDPEPAYDELVLDSMGIVCRSYYVCGECIAAAEDE